MYNTEHEKSSRLTSISRARRERALGVGEDEKGKPRRVRRRRLTNEDASASSNEKYVVGKKSKGNKGSLNVFGIFNGTRKRKQKDQFQSAFFGKLPLEVRTIIYEHVICGMETPRCMCLEKRKITMVGR